ncbi:hypothetical protein DdX_00381 [Ditylenchus destructor]|uniref:Uncharacterized protein n=1 Tax=Ditylenchus destructor TaxID=166010 RepID=A0AAD4NDM8_9BILA|nr:hypothetical protein DdX_00381 [Ditylenchus destructor]
MSSRSTVSAEPTTSSSVTSRDEERVRAVLRELRQKNVSLEQDILKLERALSDPSYRKIVEQIYSCASNNSSGQSTSQTNEERVEIEVENPANRVERCRKFITPKVQQFINGKKKPKQKLVFGLVDISKEETSGVLRIADRIVSLDYILTSELINCSATTQSITKTPISQNSPGDGAVSPSGAQPNSTIGTEHARQLHREDSVKRRFEGYLKSKAAESGDAGLVVFGVIRQVVKPMAESGPSNSQTGSLGASPTIFDEPKRLGPSLVSFSVLYGNHTP